MNLKNSKFFKRIQELRRVSREKLRREKEKRSRVCADLENALQERNGIQNQSQNKETNIDSNHLQALEEETEKEDIKNESLIQLNEKCFRIKCTTLPQKISEEDLPTISGTKSSICVVNSRYANTLGKVSKSLGYKLVKENKMWNILWTDSMPNVDLLKNMKRFQQINHYPGMMEICRKDLLSRNLNRMLKLFPRDYKIFPKTWIFPADYGEALAYSNNSCKCKPRTFILKPDSGAQGRGIWLTNDLKSINTHERMICQTYISKPLLIDGYKFDLRVYTLITSVDPLRIFVYNEGLARFATNKYIEPNPENSADLFMHLTNYSVNKRSSQYDICDNDDAGSKRKLSAINKWLKRRNYCVEEFWNSIDDIIIKTVLSAWPMLKHNYHACFTQHDTIQACFEILGFDILVDSKLKPYILEVNHSPSFHTNESVDRQVKRALIKDTLNLVSTVLADKRQILREDRKRVKQRLLKLRPGDITQRLQNNMGITAAASSLTTTTDNPNDDNKQIDTELPIKPSMCPLGALAQQIAWEESHLGDFRRIMPPHNPSLLNYYCQFYALQNEASLYGETTASKKREEVARKMRQQMEEKRRKEKELLKNATKLRLEGLRKRKRNMTRAFNEKQRLYKYHMHAQWTPGFISEAEERLRRSWMQMRVDMLKNMKIVQLIFSTLYKAKNLTNADILNYPDLYRSLENGYDIFAEE